MIPGTEHVVVYLWQEWIRNGRRHDAAWSGNRRVLRLTSRYRASIVFMFLLMSWLVYLLVGFVLQYPNEPGLLVLLAAAGFIWVLATGGTAFAFLENLTFDHAMLSRRSLFRAQQLRWDELDRFEFPANGDVVLASASGKKLRVSSSLDGLGTLLAEMEGRFGSLPIALEERLAVAAKNKPKAPLIAR